MSEITLSAEIETLLAKYDRPVPRYTSFPTAVQFHNDFPVTTYEERLKSLDPDKPVSLYVHIPFCNTLCHYCGCHTKIVSTYRPVEQYIALLVREIAMAGEIIGRRIPVARIHFGGGSPDFASADDIEKILQTFGTYFDMGAHTQIDMESDPRLLSADKIKAFAALGVSRMSLGIQDFDADVQSAINRIQPFSLVEEAVQRMRGAGITRINFDLIIGLPEQTMESVSRTLDQVLVLQPSRIAVFPYAHVPWMKKHQKLLERYEMPDTKTRFAMAQLVQDRLCANGYDAIGIDHYAQEDDALSQAMRAGTMNRNFQGYTDDDCDTIVAFGLSSISQFDDLFVQNTTDAPTYRQHIDEGRLPVARGLPLSDDDKVRRDLIAQLMSYFTVQFSDYEGIEVPRAALTDLQADGLVEFDQERLSVTDKGKAFTRVVASCFDPYFREAAGRHSRAV